MDIPADIAAWLDRDRTAWLAFQLRATPRHFESHAEWLAALRDHLASDEERPELRLWEDAYGQGVLDTPGNQEGVLRMCAGDVDGHGPSNYHPPGCQCLACRAIKIATSIRGQRERED